ncbi:MAG TPA: polyphosphate kinase 2 [Tepidisphaeraceae bacterium]|jgi:polyphosphate kinase 2
MSTTQSPARIGRHNRSNGRSAISPPQTSPRHRNRTAAEAKPPSAEGNGAAARTKDGKAPDMKRKEYEKAMKKLQGELVKVQLWAKYTGAKIVVVFEGRDAAGKGGVIKALTERTSPRAFRIAALPAPTEREKTQMYIQRYIEHLPAGGEIVLFDRSWYNRAGVEAVMGFCKPREVERFLKLCPGMESAIMASGIQLIKYWFEVSQKEQTRRFKSRIDDPRKIWKLSGMDLESHRRWYDYSRARDAMFHATDTNESPWYVVRSDDKCRARLNCISHLLSLIPYEDVPREKIKLPKRQKAKGYVEPSYPWKLIPQAF